MLARMLINWLICWPISPGDLSQMGKKNFGGHETASDKACRRWERGLVETIREISSDAVPPPDAPL